MKMNYEPTGTTEEALLAAERLLDLNAELALSPDSFTSYWADSASASVLRDYRAGRVEHV
jgi:hypothetical protein